MSNMHNSFCSFLFLFHPQKIEYLGIALVFNIHLSIHPINTGDESVYYYLYYEEA